MNKNILYVILLLWVTTSVEATVIGGIEFPDGDLSFADSIVSYNPGVGVLSPDNDNASNALGIPDFNGNVGEKDVSLGWGGSLVLQFTNNSLTTSGNSDLDLWVFEIAPAVEVLVLKLVLMGVIG